MKGLWIKDMILMKGQKQFWIGILVITLVLLGYTNNFAFVVCYVAIVASMFVLTAMGYDEARNGLSYLFTLPVSRKSYLREKYLLGAALSLFAVLCTVLGAAAVSFVKHGEFGGEEVLAALAAGVILAMVVLAVSLPLQIRFGAEKGRIALLAVYGAVFALGFAAQKMFPAALAGMFARADRFLENSPAAAVLGGAVIMLLFLGISYLTAVRFMKKKQF